MLIYLDEYRRTKTPREAEYGHYEEELLCVNWNPAIGVVAMSCYQRPQELSPLLPEDFAVVDAQFMDRIYALASQI